MKFNLKDFLELDTKSLLAVNGGTDCSGSSSPSSPSDSGNLCGQYSGYENFYFQKL